MSDYKKLCYLHDVPDKDIDYFYDEDCPYCDIDRLKGELEETNELSKKECREHVLFAHATGERIGALEGQLAEAKESEAVDAARIHLFDEEVEDLRKQLAEARAENERLRDKLSDAYDDHCDSH